MNNLIKAIMNGDYDEIRSIYNNNFDILENKYTNNNKLYEAYCKYENYKVQIYEIGSYAIDYEFGSIDTNCDDYIISNLSIYSIKEKNNYLIILIQYGNPCNEARYKIEYNIEYIMPSSYSKIYFNYHFIKNILIKDIENRITFRYEVMRKDIEKFLVNH